MYISWTDFGDSNRVHILREHSSRDAGVKSVKRFGKIYPNLKLVVKPYELSSKSGDISGEMADYIRNSPVIFEVKNPLSS
jgi:hypothetical protein